MSLRCTTATEASRSFGALPRLYRIRTARAAAPAKRGKARAPGGKSTRRKLRRAHGAPKRRAKTGCFAHAGCGREVRNRPGTRGELRWRHRPRCLCKDTHLHQPRSHAGSFLVIAGLVARCHPGPWGSTARSAPPTKSVPLEPSFVVKMPNASVLPVAGPCWSASKIVMSGNFILRPQPHVRSLLEPQSEKS